MFTEVQRLLNSAEVTEDELSSAAAHLLKNQFIFRTRNGDKKHYQLVERNINLFRNAFAFFGAELVKNVENGFIGFLPRKSLGNLKIVETFCLLTFRLIYDQEKLKGNNEGEGGSILVSGERFALEYKKNTNNREDLDRSQSYMAHLKPLEQKRIIRFGVKDPDTNMREIFILPTIEVVIDEKYTKVLIKSLTEEMSDAGEMDDVLIEDDIDEID